MGRATRGCGCAIAVLFLIAVAAGAAYWKFVRPWLRNQPPPASGGELTVRILDVGPVNGDSILITSPAGKTVLIDAGDTTKGKAVVDALKRNNIQQLDYFIATHPHPDHIGGSAEVFKAVKVLNVIDNGEKPSVPSSLTSPSKPTSSKQAPSAKKQAPSLTKFYDDYKAAVSASNAHYETAKPGTKYDLGGGVLITVLAPSEPFFTKDQMKTGGNEPNANSIVVRLDYGKFSMLLAGDAEEQTEHRLLTKDLDLQARVLKIGHHGSKYASSADFLKRVKPEIAIVSCGAWNRYGHPSQAVLDRLKAANVKLYRTDLHGEITITTRGAADDISVKPAKEPTEDAWAGRIAQKDDSSRSGFIAYGDFGPPPRPPKPKKTAE
ncbi:MAG TPA: ComEC/Rec2 family competence protein [Pyrinomonadaceae bacterium]